MIEEHEKIIMDSINENFEFLEKHSDFEIDSNFQLSLSQLDLFKVISGLVIGVIGIGYFYNKNLDSNFLIISIGLAMTTLLFSVSYTREVIDSHAEQNKKTHIEIKKKMDENTKVALDSLKKNDSSVYFNYMEELLKNKYLETQLNYVGEIIIFLFYSSVGFLVLSFFSYNYGFSIISYWTVLLLVVTYFLSFKNWSMILSSILSKNLKKKQ